VQKLAGNSGLAAEIVAEIVERTDGVPLSSCWSPRV
jgi:hypothetical protein